MLLDFNQSNNYIGSNDLASWQKTSNNPKGVGRNACCMGYRRPRLRKAEKTMKRIDNIYDQIISIENLRQADEKARRGKLKSYGVRVHDKNREANIEALHEALLTKTFKTSPYEVFTIYEPKERLIYRLPYYPDRIVHHAIMNVLEPIWVSTFTADTFSCIKGRGIHGCMRRVDKALQDKEGTRYCLKLDIKKFYPSIDHQRLKEVVRRKIKDERLLWLLDEIIDSADGVPIGNYLSQYLANLYLTYFDHWLKEELKVKYYFRYADDIVFLHESKEYLHALFRKVERYLREELLLTVKDNYQVFPIAQNRQDRKGRGLDFVGFVFYRNQKCIRKCIKKNFCRAAARLNRNNPPPDLKQYKQEVASWLGWAKYSNSKHLLKTIIKTEYYDSIL